MKKRPKHESVSSFAEFWPIYIGEHSQPLTRWLHFIGTVNMLGWLVVMLLRRQPKFLLGGLLTSYAFAWTGHFLVERNRPATFRHPILASLGDLQLVWRMCRGEFWRGRIVRDPLSAPKRQ